MAMWKKVTYPIVAVVVLAGYITLAAFVLNTFFKPSQASSEGVSYGAYRIVSADGVQDTAVDNDETAFNNIDGGLLHSGDNALSDLKLVTLYDVRLIDGETGGGEIEIEISDELMEDKTLAVVFRTEELAIELVEARKEVRTDAAGEQYNVVVFDVQNIGYYGIVSQRKVARFDWMLAVFCIATVCGLFVFLFGVLKGKTEKYREIKE